MAMHRPTRPPPHRRRPWPSPSASRLTTHSLLLALLALLSGCLIDTTAKTPTPPPPTPTPRPTPTATPGVLPIRPPTLPPVRESLVTATPPAVSAPDIRAAGQIVYLTGRGGRRDIASIEPPSGDQRFLNVGTYNAPVWSPDGGRFAAYGATVVGGRPDQLVLFAGNGRALARYALEGEGVGVPVWSPDGRYLLALQRNPAETSGTRTAWIVDEDGPRPLPLPAGAVPWRWTPDNRLAYINYPPGGQRRVSQSNPLAIWSADPAGGTDRKEIEGVIAPLGWSPSGQTFYAFDGLLPDQGAGVTRATSLIAIDRRLGNTRSIITAEAIAAAGGGARGGTHWFEGGSVAPAGGQLALWLGGVGGVGTPAAAGQLLVALVDEVGRLLLRETVRGADFAPAFAWSPGGLLVAYIAATDTGGALHILSSNGQPPLIYPLPAAPATGDTPPTWSPDSRWVAIGGPGGLTIAATIGDPRTFALVADASIGAPAWRPAALR